MALVAMVVTIDQSWEATLDQTPKPNYARGIYIGKGPLDGSQTWHLRKGDGGSTSGRGFLVTAHTPGHTNLHVRTNDVAMVNLHWHVGTVTRPQSRTQKVDDHPSHNVAHGDDD